VLKGAPDHGARTRGVPGKGRGYWASRIRGPIARAVPAARAGGLQQLLNLRRRQVFARVPGGIRLPARVGHDRGWGPLKIAGLRA
jgi:hypothetical protein